MSGAPTLTAPDMAETLTRAVGDRVRHARSQAGLSRRALSDLSGVSQRYLAQIEAGQGNISIGLLLKVAGALDQRIEWLIGGPAALSAEAMRTAELFQVASPAAQHQVMDILAPHNPKERRAQRVGLVGLRGAGKSSLGARLGRMLDAPFIELNEEIETRSGMPLDDVLALYGPEGYRKLERQALSHIVENHDRLVLAVAGGIVSAPDSYAMLLNRFHTVWLKAAPEEHMARVRAQGDERPMAGHPDAMDELRAILQRREALYQRASATLDTAGKTFEDTAAKLATLIAQEGFLG